MFRSWDSEAGWVTGGGDGVAAGVVCSGTSSGIPDTRALNYFSMTNSEIPVMSVPRRFVRFNVAESEAKRLASRPPGSEDDDEGR